MEKSVMIKPAKAKSVANGYYVEYTKVEVPLSIRKALFADFKKTRPKGVDLSDDEVQEMVNEVRYGNKHGKYSKFIQKYY